MMHTESPATQTAAAHIITTDAVAALGEPEIIVMERDDHGTGGAQIIGRVMHFGDDAEVESELHRGSLIYTGTGEVAQWRTTSDPRPVETGYWIVDVERI